MVIPSWEKEESVTVSQNPVNDLTAGERGLSSATPVIFLEKRLVSFHYWFKRLALQQLAPQQLWPLEL